MKRFKKRNKDIQALYDLPVGGHLEFEGECTSEVSGIYRKLHSSLHRDGAPFFFKARSVEIDGKTILFITKTGINFGKYSDEVVSILKAKMGIPLNDDSLDDKVAQIKKDDALEAVLEHKGLNITVKEFKDIVSGVYEFELD